ncbi:hypothetical protein CCYA_CCYA15G3982 [Cyanidiococcus yangmingshanensis]|nr:hypothetical protein CCYA_CCYA15G3982 [Cyanidiococcus yangmingshanensis]
MNSAVRYRDEPVTSVFSGLGVGSGVYFGCGLGLGKIYGAFYLPQVQLSVGVGCGLQVGFGWGFFLYGWGACVWSVRSMLGLDERDLDRMLKQLRQQSKQESSHLPGKQSLSRNWLHPLRFGSQLGHRYCTPPSTLTLGDVFRWQRRIGVKLEPALLKSLSLASLQESLASVALCECLGRRLKPALLATGPLRLDAEVVPHRGTLVRPAQGAGGI